MADTTRAASEARRLQALDRYDLLDTAADAAVDALTALAARLLASPIALVSLVDDRRQWFRSRVDFAMQETPRELSFCAYALDRPAPLVVEDATADPRFQSNPLVLEPAGIRFYAGAPLRTPDGHALGTLCVMDRVPRTLTEEQAATLGVLADQVMAHLEMRRQARALASSDEHLSAVFRRSPVGVFVQRARDRVFVDANEAFGELVGYTRDEIIGRTPDELDFDQAAAGPVRETLRERGAAHDVRLAFTARDGATRHVRADIALAPLYGEPHVVATVIDLTDRVRTEHALRQSEERLRLALAAAHMGTFDWDIPNGHITWSRGHEQLWGFAEGTFDGTYDAFASRVHPEDLPGVNAEVSRCIERREPYDREFRVRWPDGTTRWVLGRGEFDVDPDGQPQRMRGVVMDTTARRRAEEHVRRLNRAYAVLSDINQTIVRQPDLGVVLQAACRTAVEKGGFLMAWIGMVDARTGRLDLQAHAGADEDTLAIVRRLLAADPPAGCAFAWEALRLGSHAVSDDIATDQRAASWREEALARGYQTMAAFPLMVGGRVQGVFGVYGSEPGWFDAEELQLFDELASDLSYALEVHERDRAGRQAEARFRQLAESIQQVFWMVDPESGEILYVSPAYEAIWGRTCESLYRAPIEWFEAIHPDDRARVSSALRARLPGGSYDEVYRIIRPDGTIRWIRDRAYPVQEPQGQAPRIAGTATDITEQRQLEDQLRQSQKMESVGRLAGGIAHDFNNLLTVINGIADLAMLGLPEPDPLRADLEQIRQAGERAAALTRQLLALSRRQILKPRVLSLSTVVAHTEGMLRRLIGEDIRVELDLARPLGYVRADPGQIEQVILNLAVNARDAMPQGGVLRLETRDVVLEPRQAAELALGQPGQYVKLTVSDTGSGMDDATRQMIFEPFFTTKEVGKGTGLGLSTVYGIVRQSDGAITVESEPGRGATFCIYLPSVPAVADEAQASAFARTGDGHETILVVEDEGPLRQLTRRILEGAGYRVIEASSGEEALDRLAIHHGEVHLVVTDVVMPGMSGRELAVRVQQRRPSVKVLYVSGYTDDAVLRHGVLADAGRFLGKPYSPAELTRKVRDLLDG